MKILRKFLSFILGLILVNLIGVFCLSIAIKDIFQNQLIGSLVKESFLPVIESTEGLSEEQREIITNFVDNDESSEIINEFVGNIIADLGSDSDDMSEYSMDEIFDYLIENKAKLEEITGQDIDTASLEELKNSDDYKIMNEAVSETINQTRSELGPEEKMVIKSYSFLTSDSFRNTIILISLFVIALLALVQWSLHKWIPIFGRSLYITGITLIVMFFGVDALMQMILQEAELNITIDSNLLLTLGASLVIVGLLLNILYKIIVKKIKKQRKEEIQEVNNEEESQMAQL